MYVVLEERARRERKKKSSTARNGPRAREKGRERIKSQRLEATAHRWPRKIIMIISVGLERDGGAKIR